MHATKKTTTLSNGATVFVSGPDNAEMIQTQVSAYFEHGVSAVLERERPVVVDVGANIGIFTLDVLRRSHGRAEVFAYEPIPDVFEILALNRAAHDNASVTLLNRGLGAKRETLSFAFNPVIPLIGSMYELNLDAIVERILTVVYDRSLDNAYRRAVPPLLGILPRPVLRPLVKSYVGYIGRKTRRVTCEVETLSDLIAREAITTIDLLKIDVERAELDVLLGIAEQDWPKIQTIAMEIHDLDGRLETIKRMLQQRRFAKIVVDQEDVYKDSDVFSLYALRTEAAQPPRPARDQAHRLYQ